MYYLQSCPRCFPYILNAANLTYSCRTRPKYLLSQWTQWTLSDLLFSLYGSKAHLRCVIKTWQPLFFPRFIHPKMIIRISTHLIDTNLFCSDGSVSQSQDDSIVGTRQCRHSLAIMPIPGTLSSSSPDLLQPTTSILDFSNPSGKTAVLTWFIG